MATSSRRSFERGDHICALYSSERELATLAANFLAEGLARRERCWYVAAGNEGASVRAMLGRRGVKVDAAVKRGALNIIADPEAYLVRGEFDAEHTIAVFSDAIEQALHDGFSGFRAAADMSWALSLKDGGQCVIAYEALLRSLFATSRVIGLCLYDRNRMPLAILHGALMTHPIARVDGPFDTNPFYDPRVRTIPTAMTPAVQARFTS